MVDHCFNDNHFTSDYFFQNNNQMNLVNFRKEVKNKSNRKKAKILALFLKPKKLSNYYLLGKI